MFFKSEKQKHMPGFLDQFRKKVFTSVWKDVPESLEERDVDDKIALGVLLWIVAEADKKFLPEEKDEIKEILKKYSDISEDDLRYVLESVALAAQERIDLYKFTHEVSENLPYDVKKTIVEQLFRVACADGELANEEHEIIRKISGLFWLDHKDFIDAKIKVKKEFGLDTAGL